MPEHSGWTCPKCGRVWAPTKGECVACNGSVQPTVVPYQPVTPLPWYPSPQPYYSPAPLYPQSPLWREWVVWCGDTQPHA